VGIHSQLLLPNTLILVRTPQSEHESSSTLTELLSGAGIDQTNSTNNRTLWPITGGSLDIDFHHPFTYVFINLGLGTNATNFNISLTALPLNETGNGTLCLPQLVMPAGLDLQDGTNASIQISTVGPEGTALYNVSTSSQ
jgi:hypothetical protein